MIQFTITSSLTEDFIMISTRIRDTPYKKRLCDSATRKWPLEGRFYPMTAHNKTNPKKCPSCGQRSDSAYITCANNMIIQSTVLLILLENCRLLVWRKRRRKEEKIKAVCLVGGNSSILPYFGKRGRFQPINLWAESCLFWQTEQYLNMAAV